MTKEQKAILFSVCSGLRTTFNRALRYDLIEHQCTATSLLAIPIIRIVAPEEDWFIYCGNSHAWIQSNRNTVVDLTYKQFDKAYPAFIVQSQHEVDWDRYNGEKLNLIEERKCREGLTSSFENYFDGPQITIGPTGLKEHIHAKST